MQTIKLSQNSLNKSAEVLKQGGVVVFATDTVYGFLADASSKKAVEKIYKIKNRPKSKPLAVFVSGFKIAKELAEINLEQEKIIKKYWPGRHTFILKVKSEIPNSKFLTKKGTIALRIPKHKYLNSLLKKVNRPLAQTSVNTSGQPPLRNASDIFEAFSDKKFQPNLIIDAGNLPKRKPSSIMDLSNEKIKYLRK